MKKNLFTIASLALGFILNAQVCLTPSIPISLTQQPFSITSADFNGDGTPDVATANRNNNSISVLLGDGAGSFTTTTSFTVGSAPVSITNADFNADGKLDLATANNSGGNVSVLLGDGAGNFTLTTTVSAGSAPFSITKGDFNEDGKIDLAVANNSSNNISIFLGNGLGGFAAAINFNAGTGPISVINADFNSDSNLDLGVSNYSGNNVSILFGDGLGSFAAAVNFSVGTFPRSITNADFNADGNVDLATANDGGNNMSVLLGDGIGNFTPAGAYTVGTNPYSVTSGDFNSDGKTDLVTANLNSNNVSVLLGNGAGSFAAAVNFTVGSVARSVISADFNSDGKDDLASANFISLSIFLNQTPSVTANSTATTVCAGTNITLTGGGAITYTWSGGVSDGVAFFPPATATYTVIGTDGNGCTNTAVKTVVVNTLPTANAGLDQSLTCSTTSVTLLGSATPTSCTPVWTGPVSSGANSYLATTSVAGNYTLTVTDPSNGCSEMDIVQVISNSSAPTVSITVSQSVICTGGSSTLNASSSDDPNTDYSWNPGSLNGSTQNISPLSTTLYSVVVTNTINGCATTETVNITVITAPTAAITGNTLVCLGNSFAFTSTVTVAVGTPTLGWRDNISSPLVDLSTNSTLTYSPTLGGTAYQFFLVVTDFYGCTATSNTIIAQCNPLYQIDGQALTGLTPTITPVSGSVTLYKYESFLGKFDSISTTPTGVVGDFNFAAIPEGDYILKAVPSATILQSSYHGTNAISWKDATPFNHTCLSQSTKNIDVILLENIGTGPGVLTGSVYQGNGFGNRFADESKPMVPGTPIGGIIVKGGKNPGGQMFVQTITAADGTYTLSGMPVTTGDTYFILVDIPGLDTNGTYRRILTPGTPQINGLDFMVDSIYIYPIGMATSIVKDDSVFNQEIKLFPNPSKELAFIEYELIESAHIEIELFDIVGQKIKTISPYSKQEKNKYKHSINLGDLSSGIYFVKVKINDSENVIKLIITN